MGTNMFKHRGNAAGAPAMSHPANLNLMARSQSAPGFAGMRASGKSAKDLGAASAFIKAGGAVQKSAATDAKGPKV